MRTLKFEGFSDDTACCSSGGSDVDHDDCAAGTLRAFRVCHSESPALLVFMQYAPVGECWMVGVAPEREDTALPDWPMTWGFERYSTTLCIEVPDSTEVALMLPKGGEES
jgi:hypothetical protein